MRSKSCYLWFVWFTCLVKSGLTEETPYYIWEQHLKDQLLTQYDATTPPIQVEKQAINVSLQIGLNSVDYLDEETETLTTHIWLRQMWTDVRLTWNEMDFGGIKKVAIPYKKLWRPDIVPYNIATDLYQFSSEYNCLVKSDGEVWFIPHIRLYTSCALDLEFFPFDQQTCRLKFGSWIYNGNEVLLQRREGGSNGGLDINNYKPSLKWELVDTSETVNAMKYDCCEEPYYDLTATLTLRRRGRVLMTTYVGPAVCFGLLVPVIFLLPATSNHKLILGSGILISQTLILQNLLETLPRNHLYVPHIALYFLANTILLSLSLALSAVIINLWERSKRGGPGVPAVVDSVFLGIFGRLFCVRRENYMEHVETSNAQMDSQRSEQTSKDNAQMMTEYSRLVAPAEWRQLSAVLDRLLLVVFLIITILVTVIMYFRYPTY